MDIFRYRAELIGDYSAYVKGFLGIQDDQIGQFINSRLDGGFLWPEPLVQLNPAFVEGPTIDELVDQKKLHPSCREIFRRGKTIENPVGAALRLHWHQAQALSCAQKDVNYVLTTGTGSGKSLAYLIPIIAHVLKTGICAVLELFAQCRRADLASLASPIDERWTFLSECADVPLVLLGTTQDPCLSTSTTVL